MIKELLLSLVNEFRISSSRQLRNACLTLFEHIIVYYRKETRRRQRKGVDAVLVMIEMI